VSEWQTCNSPTELPSASTLINKIFNVQCNLNIKECFVHIWWGQSKRAFIYVTNVAKAFIKVHVSTEIGIIFMEF
jgi:hypothetical protein